MIGSNKKKKPQRPVIRIDLDGHFGPCVASVSQSRHPMFSPSLKAVPECEWTGTTPWGTVTVKGKISQIHRSILDAIQTEAIAKKENDDGSLTVVVDPYRIAKSAGISTHDREWLQSKIEDMVQSLIIIKKTGQPYSQVASLIHSSRPTDETVPMPCSGRLPGCENLVGRPLLRIVISAEWRKIERNEMGVRYKLLIPKIVALKSGVAQALVRFLLTHTETHCQLTDVLTWIGALRDDISRSQRHRIVFAIRQIADTLENDFGISIEGDSIHYRQHPLVRFTGSEAETSE